jgi:hypothetical protein
MTQDEIIEMAREADGQVTIWVNHSTIQKTTTFTFESPLDCYVSGEYPEKYHIKFLEAFAKLVAAKAFQNGYEKGIAAFNEAVSLEREACAKVCEKYAAANTSWTKAAVKDCAAIIRARGQA